MNSELSTSIWAYLDRAERAIIVGRPNDHRLAHGAVAILQREFIDNGTRAGDLIGTLPEIRQRYGLGRWACREAVGILEMRGWVESRRGVGGGLVLTLPSVHDITQLMLVHLCLKGACTDQIIEVRCLVHRAVVGILMRHNGEAIALQPVRLDEASLSARDFSCWLAAQTGNRALEFAMNFVTGLHEECVDADLAAAPAIGVQLLWNAICEKNIDKANAALDFFVKSTEHLRRGERVNLPDDFLRDDSGRASSSAARLARLLITEIARQDGRRPISLGTEADVSVRHCFHHEVVRQAIRVLEDIGIVVPRRGGHGGLTSRDPDLAAIIELIPPLLSHQNVPWSEVVEAMTLLKREAAYLAAWRVRMGVASEKVWELAEQLLSTRPTQTNDLITMENCLMDLAENSVLSAFDRGLLLYGPMASSEFADHAPLANAAFLHMPHILKAIVEGGPEAAEAAASSKLSYMSPVYADHIYSARRSAIHL